MNGLLLAALALAAGYGIGRLQPARRACEWANWAKYGATRRGPHWWAIYAVLSAENLTWLALHPVKGFHAWKRRNDPPPPLAPAPKFNPDWARQRKEGPQ